MNTLQSIYQSLEKGVTKLRKEREFAWELKKNISDSYSDEEKEIISWEAQALHFQLEEGKTKAVFSHVAQDGTNVNEYPSHSFFTEATYEYFAGRASTTKNDYLIIRYNQIIWNGKSRYKREQQPKTIIDISLGLLANVDTLSKEEERQNNCLNILKNALSLSFQIKKYRYRELLKILRNWLIIGCETDYSPKYSLINFINNHKKNFSQKDLAGVLVVCNLVLDELFVKKDIFLSETLADMADKIAHKMAIKTKHWQIRKAEAYINFANCRLDDDTKMIPVNSLSKAQAIYQQIGEKELAAEVGVSIAELRKELNLKKVRLPIDEKGAEYLTKYMDAIIESLLNGSTDKIYVYLSSYKDFFPTVEWINDLVSKQKGSFTDYITLLQFDINNNLKGEQDSETQKFYEQYGFFCNIYTINFLHQLFQRGIIERKITFESLMKYLNNHSWLGQKLEEVNSVEEVRYYTWLQLIAPSIYDFFHQVEFGLMYNQFNINFITCLDSITLKFEGIIRDLLRRHQINTLVSTRGGGTREMFIDDFLNMKEITQIISVDDVHFFRYVFTSKGLNIRNNIAHCFYRPESYSHVLVLLVLVAILRVSNYKMENNS